MGIDGKGTPSVSIITGFFKAENFIQETIESVFAQSYEDWELLLVNDGSSERDGEIARRYAQQFPQRVFYLEHPGRQNRGISATRNRGIAAARGQFLAFLDADDIWVPHKLEEQVAILQSFPEAGMVYGKPLYWYSWTGDPADLERDHVPGAPVNPGGLLQPPELMLRSYPLGNGQAPCPSDLLVRRALVERLGGFEEQFAGAYQMYEDQAFLAKVYLAAPVFVADACWLKYRVHAESCVAQVRQAGQYHTVRRFFLQWLGQYLAEQRVTDAEILTAFRKALRPYRYPILSRVATQLRRMVSHVRGLARQIAQ